jgi:homogentisate phytyltransferase/homogentisate geranylgeranyltransferase
MSRISSQNSSHPQPLAANVVKQAPWLYAFWKFSRPHTIIGTSLSVLGLYLIAIATPTIGFSWGSLGLLLGAWTACLCGNVYIVGLNQIEDVAIDRINKPDLPIASGEFSRQQAVVIVAITGTLALLIAFVQGPFLLGMVGLSLAIGTAYSLPPIRLKRHPFWASLCILSVRGAIVNLGLFLHFSQRLTGVVQPISPEVWTLALFVVVFSFAIAIFKDIPDLEGDRKYNITTFTIRLGTQAVFNLARWVLTACYLGMILAGALWLPEANPLFLVMTHLVALGGMWFLSLQVNLQDRAAIAHYYQFIWKLFFLEYLIFPAACLLG